MPYLKFFIIAFIFLVVGYLGYNYYSKETGEPVELSAPLPLSPLPKSETKEAESKVELPVSEPAPADKKSNKFRFADLKVGDKIVGMTLESIKPAIGTGDYNERNVSLQFSGEAIITGTYSYGVWDLDGMEHACFYPDQVSNLKSPRAEITEFSGFSYFCFENLDLAKSYFNVSPKGPYGGNATVKIDNYRLNVAETEVNDEAELVQVIDKDFLGVYFLNQEAFDNRDEPYEALVTREFDPEQIDEVEVLTHIFRGPTPEERQAGLVSVLSGAKGFELRISKGVARVYLKGGCSSGGSTYTIANLIFKNLSQFSDIKTIKIYDPQGQTAQPDGEINSIPECLEP